MEFTREIQVSIHIVTNKQTIDREFTPDEDESHAQFAARVWDTLTEILELVNR